MNPRTRQREAKALVPKLSMALELSKRCRVNIEASALDDGGNPLSVVAVPAGQ